MAFVNTIPGAGMSQGLRDLMRLEEKVQFV